MFGGTFGVAYGLFLFTTALMLKVFAPAVITAAGRMGSDTHSVHG